jgi:integrase
MTRAIDIGIRGDDPTRSRARLALALLLYTGQRRGDVIRMEAQQVRGGIIYVKQEKTGRACYPDASGSRGYCRNAERHLTRLTTTIGGPFAATTFTHWYGANNVTRQGFHIALRTD